ncbi:Uncharacterised protein [uncultured archaeon]|nr:Uncharacterised protein [uncultured archaeon]
MKLRIAHIMVRKSVCKWVKISGSAMSNAVSWTETSKVPIVVTESAVHSYPCQFSASSFMLESRLLGAQCDSIDAFISFIFVSFSLI